MASRNCRRYSQGRRVQKFTDTYIRLNCMLMYVRATQRSRIQLTNNIKSWGSFSVNYYLLVLDQLKWYLVLLARGQSQLTTLSLEVSVNTFILQGSPSLELKDLLPRRTYLIQVYWLIDWFSRSEFIMSSRAKRACITRTARGLSQMQN